MGTTKEVQNIAVPKILAQRIKELVSSRLGYQTVAEYVRTAIREKLDRDEYRLQDMKKEYIIERESQAGE